MSTPTDPYNSQSRRPFDDDEILAPLSEELDGPINNDAQQWEEGTDFTGADAPETFEPEHAPETFEPEHAPETFDAERTEFPAEPEFEPADFGAEPLAKDTPFSADADSAQDTPLVEDVPAAEDVPVPVALDADDSQPDDLPIAPIDAPVVENSGDPSALESPSYIDEDDDETANPTLGAYFASTENTTPADEMVIDYGAAQEEPTAPTRTSVIPASDLNPETTSPTVVDNTDAAVVTAPALVAPADTQTWSHDPGEITEIPEAPKKRIGAHFASFFLTLLLVPVAWYLLSDASTRLFLVENNPWATQQADVFPILELVGGIVVVGILWLLAHTSSLGAQLWGAILTIAGLAAIIVPKYGVELISRLNNAIGDYNPFTGNVVHHLNQDLGSGRVAVFGALLLLTGLVAHQARKRGQERGDAIARRELLLKNDEN